MVPSHPAELSRLSPGLIVVGSVGYFLFRVFRQRRKYQALPKPPSATFGAYSQEGIMKPVASGEMGYAGPQPQLPYNAPTLRYNAPPNAPQDTKPLGVAYPPSGPQYNPPPGPPPQSAATHYGYSAGAI